MNTNKMNLLQVTGRAILLGGTILAISAGSAYACSLANWSSTSGSIFANQPDGASGDPVSNTDNVPRYAGLCGSTAPDGVTAFVQDDRPGGIDRIIARFYVLNGGASNAVVYRGNNSGGAELFNVTLDGGDATFNAGAASASASTQAGWNSIEIDWDSAGGIGSLIVNGGAPVALSGAVAAGAVANVQLGNVNGASGGDLSFDGYEAHLSTPVGRICNCNANGSADDAVNVQDVVSVVNEAGGGALASGTPDCNENGSVNVQDVVAIVNIAGGTGACLL